MSGQVLWSTASPWHAAAVARAAAELGSLLGTEARGAALPRDGDEAARATALITLVRQADAKLVVVGSQGRGRVRSAFAGSLSRELLRTSPCPVAIVPPRALADTGPVATFTDGRGPVVCGVDGSPLSVRAAGLAADLAGRLETQLLFMHANERVPLWDAARLVAGALQRVDCDARGYTQACPPSVALRYLATRHRARVIVVGARALGRFESALRESVSAHLELAARQLLVVLPEHAQLAPDSGHYELAAPL